jgi:hypothetical protein
MVSLLAQAVHDALIHGDLKRLERLSPNLRRKALVLAEHKADDLLARTAASSDAENVMDVEYAHAPAPQSAREFTQGAEPRRRHTSAEAIRDRLERVRQLASEAEVPA